MGVCLPVSADTGGRVVAECLRHAQSSCSANVGDLHRLAYEPGAQSASALNSRDMCQQLTGMLRKKDWGCRRMLCNTLCLRSCRLQMCRANVMESFIGNGTSGTSRAAVSDGRALLQHERSQSFYTCSKLSTGMPTSMGLRALLSA